MSSIYFQLTKEFEVAETYEGGSVVEQLAETIRSQTFIAFLLRRLGPSLMPTSSRIWHSIVG